MASGNLLFLPFLLTLIIDTIFAADDPGNTTMFPFTCSDVGRTCDSILYQDNGLTDELIANLYSVNASQIKPITHFNKQNDFITVPCSCKNAGGTLGYFYNTNYMIKPNDTFENVSSEFYSGQVWPVGNEARKFIAGNSTTMHLLCGCNEEETQIVVTYTVQPHDTLSDIATLLSADISEIEKSNSMLTQRPGYIDVGYVLFVPMYKNGVPSEPSEPSAATKRGKSHKWTIIIGILSAVTVLSICTLAILLMRWKRSREYNDEDPKASKSMISHKSFSTKNQYLHKDHMEDITDFGSDRPSIYNFEEIAEATNNFDDTSKIGEGGYGSVYFGILGEKEVAVKKMRSNKGKEFLAEIKVLCKIHHINVVELLGYASGDNHLYLVYEYVSNGSLSEHLHDPLLKGNQPLSWTARAQIALDAAKGIEYIHDHTKERYVHRDIKTTNILLDEGLRAKVADFGLAKLVGRTNEDDFIATRLVGTPGYLPPESVKELQVTIKTDVFAFGVVLAELITGQRALMRDNRESNKMKSLITVINKVFQDEDPESALEAVTDGNLRSSYPPDDLYKMAEIADWCLSEDPINRPEMQEVVVALSRIVMSSIEWEASLGGDSQVFSGVFNGR